MIAEPNKYDTNIEPLEEGYYLNNFLSLITYVHDKYGTLLKPEETDFIDLFRQLSEDAQRLYVRLITRKGPYFRLDKLSYSEISDIPMAAAELESSGFLYINPREELVLALQAYTKPELIDLFKNNNRLIYESWFNRISKDELIAELIEYNESWIWNDLESVSDLLLPSGFAIVQTLQLIFFGNSYQQLSDFILEDIGVLRYEPYEIRDKDRLFTNRETIDGMIFLSALKFELWYATEVGDFEAVDKLGDLVQKYPLNKRLEKSRSKVYNSLGSFFERSGSLELALNYYERSAVSPARERKARILSKLGNDEAALVLLDAMERDPADFQEMEFAPMFREKVSKNLGIPCEKRKRRRFDSSEVILAKNRSVRIESLAADYFNECGFVAHNTENNLFNALFGLHFWDEIFSPQPEVFFNPFQRGPSDLFSATFYDKRRSILDDRLEKLHDVDSSSRIMDLFRAKHNTANWLVNWKALDAGILELALDSIPKEHLNLIFKRMLVNLREMTSGFPDLVVFGDGYKLIEVKGPGDQLRPNQRHWLGYFQDNGIPSEVLKIKWG